MPVIEASPRSNIERFQRNADRMRGLVDELRSRNQLVQMGGGERSVEKNRARGKLPARERVELLVDPDTAVLELSQLAAWDLYGEMIPSAGFVSAIGVVQGRHCMIAANDSTVKGGTYYPVSVTKHLRAQEIALENRLPCIYLVDSGGAHLPVQSELFADRFHGGRFFYNQALMSAEGIAQIACVMGSCTAGGAYVPAMCDESVIVDKTGTVFLGGPPLVKAAIGEDVTAEELGGARVHTRISGLCDHFARDDHHALSIVRSIVEHLPFPAQELPWTRADVKAPQFDPAELDGLIDATDNSVSDVREVIARIVDASEFAEFKENFGTTLVCGFAHIHGYPVSIVASNGPLLASSAQKGAHFVELCCQRRVPLLFLQNTADDAVEAQAERLGIARDTAKFMQAVSCAQVPKFTVVLGGSFGPTSLAMCGRSLQPRLLWLWPTATVEIAGSDGAAKREGPYYSTARLWDDGIIEPTQTRDVVGLGLAAATNAPSGDTSYGVLRM